MQRRVGVLPREDTGEHWCPFRVQGEDSWTFSGIIEKLFDYKQYDNVQDIFAALEQVGSTAVVNHS